MLIRKKKADELVVDSIPRLLRHALCNPCDATDLLQGPPLGQPYTEPARTAAYLLLELEESVKDAELELLQESQLVEVHFRLFISVNPYFASRESPFTHAPARFTTSGQAQRQPSSLVSYRETAQSRSPRLPQT